MNKFLQNIIKGFAHASAGGGIAIGAGLLNLKDVDLTTVVFLVVISTLYNLVREAIKNYIGQNVG